MPAARERPRGPNWRRVAIVFSITFATLLVVITVIAASYAGANEGKILPGVTVNGVSLAGLDRAAAESKLRQELPDVGAGALTIKIGSLEQTIAYADVSRDYDLAGTLDQAVAYGRGLNPLEAFAQQLRTLFGATIVEMTPAITYDADQLAQRVAALVLQAQAAPVNATITFENGEYVLTPASDGRSVDGPAVLAQASAVIASGLPDSATIEIAATTIPADISSEAAQAAIAMAQGVTTSPLTVSAGEDSFVVDATTLRQWVALEETAPGVWSLTIDRVAIDAYIATIKPQVDQEPINAQFEFNDKGEAVATAGQIGQVVDPVAATDMIYNALVSRGQGTPTAGVTLPIVATDPEFSTAEAQAMVSRVKLLGAWTTRYIPSTLNNDGINIRRPAQLINGTVVQPGELFSFVGVAGPITEENGYGEGAAIIHGKTKAEGVLGGGLCSASTTMYNAALRAGFDLRARANHAYYISRYPVGLDATIWISGLSVRDMSFVNDSEFPIVIKGINKRRSVTFQIWGIPDGRTVTLSEPEVTNELEGHEYYRYTDDLAPRETERAEYRADGFDSVVVRTVRDASGQIIHQDTIRSDYRRVDGIILLGRYPTDPVAGTLIPYGDLPPAPSGPTPTPGGGTPHPTSPPTAPPTAAPTAPPTAPPSPTP